jgi:hypothetical protein
LLQIVERLQHLLQQQEWLDWLLHAFLQSMLKVVAPEELVQPTATDQEEVAVEQGQLLQVQQDRLVLHLPAGPAGLVDQQTEGQEQPEGVEQEMVPLQPVPRQVVPMLVAVVPVDGQILL